MESPTIIPDLPINSTNPNRSIPCLGLGTATAALEGSKATKEGILNAIELGYRHFDTAAIYQTEPYVGEAIAEALSSGLISSRDELFITTKLWPCDAHQDRVLPALQNSLKNIGLEYLDLYLIHWPVALSQPGKYEYPPEKKELVLMDFKSVWEAMEVCQKLGLAKSIGVSNFSSKKLQDLLTFAKIPPAVNQVEMSPVWQQKKLREFCYKNGIMITAYSPLGAKGTLWGTNRVMDCEALHEIAASKGKSVAQICLRWVYEQGVALLVKSHNKDRIKENMDIFSWKLTQKELQKINEIPQHRGYIADHFVDENGPYKSVQEFWDGEI